MIILCLLLPLDLISLSHNVRAGTHLIEVSSLGYFFSPVRVDISARNPGHIQAALTENRKVLNKLVLEPLKEEQYYEVSNAIVIVNLFPSCLLLPSPFLTNICISIYFLPNHFLTNICVCIYFPQMREPFNILSLLKSPMGMMVGFMVVMVFVMPKMMENIGSSGHQCQESWAYSSSID
ncbi:hypothetical protein ZWY2020_019565 [Hordeum vulgare]|nr:hypothetical protein ZWY2020_019565 [Hordeum vulgare]